MINNEGSEIYFDGNSNSNTKIINYFPEPVYGRYLRLIVNQWQVAVAMRWEVHGCRIYGREALVLSILHQQTSTKLLTIWLTHCNNTVKIANIVTRTV